jgi:hypothetical protein
MVNINIEISEDLHKRIKVYCAMNEITLKDFIISTLSKNLSINKKEIKKFIKKNV